MASYRGIEQQTILKSLQDAEQFVRRQNLGPATDELLDCWLAQDPFAKIAAAKDDAALAEAVTAAHAHIFTLLPNVFEYHARQSLAAGGGEAADLYKALADWDGLYGNTHIEELMAKDGKAVNLMEVYEARSAEIDAHLIVQYAKKLTTADIMPDAAFIQRLKAQVQESAKNLSSPRVAPAVIVFMPVLVAALDTGNEVAAQSLVLAKTESIRGGFGMILKEVLEKTLGASNAASLQSLTRFEKYGMTIGPRYLYNEQIRQILPSEKEIEAALKPFYEQGAISADGIGVITVVPHFDLKKAHHGFWIRSTREAAQALADAFPAEKVINMQAEQIIPRAKPPAPGRKFSLN